MKKLLFISALFLLLTSCSADDDIKDISFTGEWKLVRTSALGMVQTGAEMEWQETYILRADGTFKKTRVRDGETITAEGTYRIENVVPTQDREIIARIAMVYPEGNPIIATCYSDKLEEDLFFRTEDLMVSNWQACDGLGLEYQRKK